MKNSLRHSEGGFTAIIITLIISVILTLVTIGFLKIVGRDQRQVVDRQQSTQAFYAAEAGINDAVKALGAGYNQDKTSCAPDGTASFPASSNVLDANTGTSYTCLTIDHAPRSLEYSSIKTDDARVIIINGLATDGVTPQKIGHLLIGWEDENSQITTFRNPPLGAFPTSAAWGVSPGVMRMSITPLSSFHRSDLINNTFTAFLYPLNGSAGVNGTTSYTTSLTAQGPIVSGSCNTANLPRKCNVDIDLTAANQSSFMLVLRSIYSPSSVSVKAYPGAVGGTALRIGGAQSLVDSTGKAYDVLRRIQARVPSRNDYAYPAAALNSGQDVCKQYSLMPDIVGLSPTNQSTTSCN